MSAVAQAPGSGLVLSDQTGATARIVEPMKTCKGPCGRRLPWSAFYASKKWEDGTMRVPQGKCKTCQLEYNANRRRGNRAHLDKHNAEQRAAREHMTPEQRQARRVNQRWSNRRRHDIPEERWRIHESDVRLNAAPFACWLRDEVERIGLMPTANSTGIDESQLRRIIERKQKTVTFEMVDRALMKSATGMWELYPTIEPVSRKMSDELAR